MQRIRILSLIALGSACLVSAIANGTSAASSVNPSVPMAISTVQSHPALLESLACADCHEVKASMAKSDHTAWVNSPSHNSSYFHYIIKSQTSSLAHAHQDMTISIAALNLALDTQKQGAGMESNNYIGPIIQCAFCHSETSVNANLNTPTFE